MNFTYTVIVIDKIANRAVKASEVIGLGNAKRLAAGIEINLNKDAYFVQITKND